MGDRKTARHFEVTSCPRQKSENVPMRKINAHFLPSPFTKSFESIKKKNLFIGSPPSSSLGSAGRRRSHGGSLPRFSLYFHVNMIRAIGTVRGRNRSLSHRRHLAAVFSRLEAMFWRHLRMQHSSFGKVKVLPGTTFVDDVLWIPSSGIFVVRPFFPFSTTTTLC